MSLKSFHIFFIVTAILLCLAFGGWALARGDLALMAGALALALLLAVYEYWFIRRHKGDLKKL